MTELHRALVRREAQGVQAARDQGDESVITRGSAFIIDPDPLIRLLASQAARDLGYSLSATPGEGEQAGVTFLGLDDPGSCPRLRFPRRGAQASVPEVDHPSRPCLVGYVGGPRAILEAHALHRCTDVIARLGMVAGRPAFLAPDEDPCSSVARRCLPVDLTPREADVLLLVLAGMTTNELAARLRISPATARSHCRSILRKSGAPNRAELRGRYARRP